MNTYVPFLNRLVRWTAAAALAFGLPASGLARVLDNFNDNQKTGWSDFTFQPGFGLPTETGGQFMFDLPAAGTDIFTASQKVSESLELKEGRTLELRVDLVGGSGEDAFAVMAFIPNTGGNSPGTLAGYGLAKDPTDVLITKGIQKYFVADDGVTAEIKQENVTLVLTLTVKSGNVIVTGKILDKEKNNAVLWERTVVDTPAADVMEDGTDGPAAPYITTGYFTLYCYEQGGKAPPYTITYDNAAVYVMDETLLDDFNDNKKSDWTDFTFQPGFGLPTETGGQFVFDLPAAGTDIFTASQKTSRSIELTEGNRVELQADLVDGSGEDAFAVMAFIPNTGGNSPGTLAGYGLAKDPTDVLITKGIQKYFVADDGVTAELKQTKVRLSLSLTVESGNVIVTGKILDMENNNAVLWERTVVDTPAADVMEDGTDGPAAPYITTGYFTLYCYEQGGKAPPYSVVYDNIVLRAPPQEANLSPLIQSVQPTEFSNFLPASTKISFQVGDDKALAPEKVSVLLNGTNFTTANGLTVTGAGKTLTATLGGLAANVNYDATLRVEDSEGEVATRKLYFDTFLASDFMIEAEDYNYGGGQFIANPVPVGEGASDPNSYSLTTGAAGVDFFESRATPNGGDTMYRPDDPVRMQRSRDLARQKYTAAGGSDGGVYDYDVIDITAGEWMNYTRNFPAGFYEVYLREALANMPTGDSVLEEVTSDRTQADQTTRIIGSFLGSLSGFQSRNFALTDGAGKNKVAVRLSGVTTLRLRQITGDPADGARSLNYLIFVPTADPGKQRAAVASVSPAQGETLATVVPVITATLQNRDTSVNVGSVVLTVNGQKVNATVTATSTGATVNYPMSPLPASEATNNAELTYKDSDGVSLTNGWTFAISYQALDPAIRQVGPGLARGFKVRVVQAPSGSGLANSLQRAEDQLVSGSTIPKYYETNVVEQVINFSQSGPGSAEGNFPDDLLIPGLDSDNNGNDDIALEAQTYLELAAGGYRFGVVSDDGYKVQATATFSASDPALAFHSGGTANETVDFVVKESGFYPFRFVWYERGGGANVEWFIVSLTTGDRALINAGTGALLVKAYTGVAAAPEISAETTAALGTAWTADSTAKVDTTAKTVKVTPSGNQKFYRLRYGVAGSTAKVTITKVTVSGADLVLTYQVN